MQSLSPAEKRQAKLNQLIEAEGFETVDGSTKAFSSASRSIIAGATPRAASRPRLQPSFATVVNTTRAKRR